MSDWIELDFLPEDLRLTGAPAPGHLFFDTNTLAREEFRAVARARGGGVISAVVLGELLARRRDTNHLANTIARLRAGRLVVASIDADVIETFWRLTRTLQFDLPPFCGPGDNEKAARKRVALDLLIFATSLRHRRKLVTENTQDFQSFGMRDCWATLSEVAAE